MLLACFILCIFLIPEYSNENKRFKIGKLHLLIILIGCSLFAVISLIILVNIILVFVEAFINIKKTYDALRNKKSRIGDYDNVKVSKYEDISSIY